MKNDTMTFAEVCEFLTIGETKLRSLIQGGFIPAGKIGSKWIMRRKDVEVYRDELIYKHQRARAAQGRKRTPRALPDLSIYNTPSPQPIGQV